MRQRGTQFGYQEEALTIRQKVCGPEDVSTLAARVRLGHAYFCAKQYHAALAHQEFVVAACERHVHEALNFADHDDDESFEGEVRDMTASHRIAFGTGEFASWGCELACVVRLFGIDEAVYGRDFAYCCLGCALVI